MNNLGWTTLEQAKKLVEAGLDPNTADMIWHPEGQRFDNENLELLTIEPYVIATPFKEEGAWGYNIPCWSLGKLLYIASCHFDNWGLDNLCFIYRNHTFHNGEGIEFAEGKSCIDNVIDAIIYGLNTKIIKKGE